MRALFTSNNLIGDGLYLGPAFRVWIKQHLELTEGNLDVTMQTLPDHVAPLYAGMVRDLVQIQTVFTRPEGAFDFEHVFDVNEAFKLSDQKKQHVAESYADLLGVKIDSVKPIYIPEADWSLDAVREDLDGCILISMFSESCESKDRNHPDLPPNKMLISQDKDGKWKSFVKWKPMLELIKKEYPNNPLRFLGAPNAVVPDELKSYGEAMFGIPLNRLALILQKAKILVSIDNGMAHLGASQETNTFLMYPRCLGPWYILPRGNPNLEWTQMNPVTVSPAELRFKLEKAIQKFKGKDHGQS